MRMFDSRQMECGTPGRKKATTGWIEWRRWQLWSMLLVALLSTIQMKAQVGGEGAIEGTVTDPTGAVVPNATVTAINVATGVSTERVSTSSGYFVLSARSWNIYGKCKGVRLLRIRTEEHHRQRHSDCRPQGSIEAG